MEISNRQGKTFYNFMSEILEDVLKLYKAGLSLRDVVNFYEFMDIYRSAGVKVLSKEVFDYLVTKLSPKDKTVLQKKWYDFGRFCGKVLSGKYSKTIDTVAKFLTVTEWELNDISIDDSPNCLRVSCVSSIMDFESTELLSNFIEGIMHEMGYTTSNRVCQKGIILLEFVKT